MSRALGCIVVGMGRAGRARAAALALRPDTQVVGEVRHADGAPDASFERALERSDVDAIFICTPNLLHPVQAERALEADKHVVVEFPLAPTRERARTLFELARARQRVLHVGHIELIAPSQLALRAAARDLGAPVSGQVAFSGGIEGWIGDASLAGTPALRALARLHRLYDLFGAGAVVAAKLVREREGYRLETELAFERGGRVRLVEERFRDAPRRTSWAVRCERGTLGDPPAASARGVFAEDLAGFVAQVRQLEGTPAMQADAEAIPRWMQPAELEARELAVLAWIEAIDLETGMHPPTRTRSLVEDGPKAVD